MLNEFKAFVLRSSAVDLAVGIVIGLAVVGLIQSLVENVFTPLLTAFADGETVSFAELSLTVGSSEIAYGEVVNAFMSLAIVAATVFFAVVRPIAKLRERDAQRVGTTKPCPACLSTIPLAASRCPFCTSEQAPDDAPDPAARRPRDTDSVDAA